MNFARYDPAMNFARYDPAMNFARLTQNQRFSLPEPPLLSTPFLSQGMGIAGVDSVCLCENLTCCVAS